MSDVGSTLKVEDLEVGKRYRISFDGEWTGHALDTGPAKPSFGGGWFLDNTSSIEKLQDPEPEWKHGTVVKAPGLLPFFRNDDDWYCGAVRGTATYAIWVSEAWKAGTLEIPYTPEG